MKIALIVAVAKKNRGIGKDNDLLWHLPADMKLFKQTTSGFPIITGRKNFESIPEKFRPLPNRENIVVTRNKDYNYNNTHVVFSLEDAIEKAKTFNSEKIFIIGGGQIYKEAIDKSLVDELYISWVDGDFEADTFFPDFNLNNWKEVENVRFEADEKNKFSFTFNKYISTKTN